MPSPNISAPFLDVPSFTLGPSAQPGAPPLAAPARSPFLSLYETDGAYPLAPASHESSTLAAEWHDNELDQHIYEAIAEASEIYDRSGNDAQVLRQHFAPLMREVEHAFDAASERFARSELGQTEQSDLEAFFDSYSPRQEMGPAFENLFGSIFNAIKKVGSAALNAAKSGVTALVNATLGPLLNKLKPIALKLLNWVLKAAISRLPESLKPIARQVAQHFGLSAEVEEADPGFGEIQQEFNQQAAELLLAPDEAQRDLEVARATVDAGSPVKDPLGELDRAREELSDRLIRLKDGEDLAPALENFIPALLPVVRLGLRLAGREGFVKFLAHLIAPLFRRFTGGFTEPLSKAIVDVGLKLLGLEVTPADTTQAARNAVISTLEDTVRRVAALPDYVLDNRELLEGAALEAFEQAAAAGFPQVLGEDVYRQRPDLRESAHTRGSWILLPICGRPRYKKFSRVLRTRITPEKAAHIETFGGQTLAEFLDEQMGQPPGGEFEGNVQLYESVPGTLLPEVARMETGTPGLGSSDEVSYGQLHPLTPEAAAFLIDEPGLGRRMHPDSMAARHAVRPGQRFYHVSVPGMRPSLSSRGPGRLRRHSHLRVVLNFKTAQIRIHLYLAESSAQKLQLKLKQQGHVGAILAWLRPRLERKLESALLPRAHGGVRIIHPEVPPQQATGAALTRLPAALSATLRFHLLHWMLHSLGGFLKDDAPKVMAAVESPHDGITFEIIFHDPPGLAMLRDAFAGRNTMAPGAPFPKGIPQADITVAAGHPHA